MIKLILLNLLLLYSVSALAGKNSCSVLFNNKQEQTQILSQNKLKASGFEINLNNELIDVSQKEPKTIGSLTVRTPKNLYEWASLEHQQYLISMGGVSNKHMKEILKAPSQTYGKGFYVSSLPMDSQEYGDGLSVFKTDGPMIYLNIYNDDYSHGASTQFMTRLQKIGVDALETDGGTRNYFTGEHSWLSIISAKHLKIVKENEIEDPFWDNLSNIHTVSLIFDKLVKSNFWKWLPDHNIYKKLYLDPLKNSKELFTLITHDDIRRIPLVEKIDELNAADHIKRNKLFIKNIEQALRQEAQKVDFAKGTDADIKKALAIFQKYNIKPKTKTKSNLISKILNYFDLKTLNTMFFYKKLQETNSFWTFDEILNITKKTEIAHKNIKISDIKNSKDFLKALQSMLDIKVKFRGYSVMMTPEVKAGTDLPNLALTVSAKIYDTLEQNNFLEYKIISEFEQNGKKYYKLNVLYMTLERLYSAIDRLPLEPKFYNYLIKNKDKILSSPGSELYSSTYSKLMSALFESFFNSDGRNYLLNIYDSRLFLDGVTPLNLYILFMSLHPFEDGNGRAGRLLYEYLTQEINKKSEELLLPLYDVDLFSYPGEIKDHELVAHYFKQTLSETQNLDEFKKMVQKFTRIYFEMYPEYNSLQ